MANSRVRLSYRFLVDRQEKEEAFTVDELALQTGWKCRSAQAYITKKLERFLKCDGEQFTLNGISDYTEDEYCRLMSQKDSFSNDPEKPSLPPKVEKLVVKAREAADEPHSEAIPFGSLFNITFCIAFFE